MEESKKSGLNESDKEIVFSQAIKAGKRIYYIDVKKNRKDEMYISITESKKLVSGEGENTTLSFEKHKIFLYKDKEAKKSKNSNTKSLDELAAEYNLNKDLRRYRITSQSAIKNKQSEIDMINAAIRQNNSSSGGSSYKPSYGAIGDKIQTNPYEDEIDRIREAYERQQNQIREQNRIAVEQGTNRLNAQKANINQAAEDNARQAYIMHMQAKKALPQQLVNQGATGGMTETANLGLQTTYQNNLNDINRNKINAIQEIDNFLKNLNEIEEYLAWAVDNVCPEALFTLIYTPAALIVIFTPSVYVEEESPFEFPLLAFAHRSRSFFLSLWGVGLS